MSATSAAPDQVLYSRTSVSVLRRIHYSAAEELGQQEPCLALALAFASCAALGLAGETAALLSVWLGEEKESTPPPTISQIRKEEQL